MSVPCPRRIREHLILFLLLPLIHSVAGAVNIHGGNILITDRNANGGQGGTQGGTQGAVVLGDESSPVPLRFLASPTTFVDPQTALLLGDGRVLVVDSNADPFSTGQANGALWTFDPQVNFPGRATLFFSSTYFQNPTDILLESSGSILVLDPDADPTNTGGHRGALFRISPDVPRSISIVATSSLWVDPRSMVFDRDGSILVWDPHADPLGLGGTPGALFRVDPTTGIVETVFSINGFTTPWAVALAPNGDYLIVDRDANPNGYPGSPGAVFRVNRDTFAVTTAAASSEFVDPYDLAVAPNGDIWVLDATANPYNYPTARGAIFRCKAADGSIQRTFSSSYFQALSGITVVPASALDSTLVSWEDRSGAPLQPGDRMRVHIHLRNSTTAPVDPVRTVEAVGTSWDYVIGSDSISTGSLSYDPSTRIVQWVGPVAANGDAWISYEMRLHDDAPNGLTLLERVTVSYGRIQTDYALQSTVSRRSAPGDWVWADYQPNPDGSTSGNIWKMPSAVQRPVLVFGGPPLVKPNDLTYLPDGRIAVLDQRAVLRGPGAVTGGVFAIDPSNGKVDTLLVVADHPEMRIPLGLATGRPNELLIVDKDANPLGLPGQPGAVFAFNLLTRQLRLIASSSMFSEPCDAILESTGTIVVVDYDADPGGQNPHGGALFQVDYDSGAVSWIQVPSGTFTDPVGLAEAAGRRLFVADLGADPLHTGRNTGAIIEVRRASNNQVGIASADTLYVDPTDVLPQDDGSLIVTDREANPYNYTPRDRGAVFKVRPYVGRPTVVTADFSLYGPEAIAGFSEGNLALSRIQVEDLNGNPTASGDSLRFEGVLRNTGKADIPDAMATILLSPGQNLVGGSGPGGVVTDPTIRAVVWSGGIPAADSVRFNGIAVVGAGHVFGDVVNGVLHVSGPGAPQPDTSQVKIVAPLGMGDIVLADLNADPNRTGVPHGALFDIRYGQNSITQVLQTDTLWTDPTAVRGLGDGRLLMTDTNGANPGSVVVADYLHARTTPYIEDARLGDPDDLLLTRSGDLLIVDPRARIDAGPPRPAVFVRRAGQSDLEVLCAETVLSDPMQITEDERGRLWLLDRRAHPDTTVAGSGAIFRIDPATGALIDTLEFNELNSPMGVVSWTGEGLVVVDLPASQGLGVVFQVDPDARTIQLRVSDPRFVLPVRAAFSPSGELWIIDRLATDPTQPGNPRALFRWDPETNDLRMVAPSRQYAAPADLYFYPGPNPRLESYTVEDVNGPPLNPGDEVIVRAQVSNVGPIATLQTTYTDTLSSSLNLDRNSVQADAGVIQTVGPNIVQWNVDLEPGDVHNVSYHAHVRSNLPQGAIVSFRSHLRSAEGVHRVRRQSFRLPVFFEDGYVYVADPEADPLQLGQGHGALYKVELSSGQAVVMGSTTLLSRPVSTLRLPTTQPNVLVIDRDANPLNHPGTRGCIWRWVPETGDFALAAADTTFRSPRAAVALNDREILMVDASARPFGLNRHGAVYEIDIPTGSVVPFASDSMFVSPTGITLDGHGGAFIIDADADPGHFGMRNGAVFRLDLLQRTFSVYAVSADFRGPAAGTIGPDGALYVLDREVIPNPNYDARGAVYRVDGLGNVTRDSYSLKFRSPYDLHFDSLRRLLVTDNAADPGHLGGNRGAIFRRAEGGDYQVFGGLHFTSPSGFFIQEEATPIDLTAFEAAPFGDAIRLTWEVGEAQFDGFICQRAPGSDPTDDAYVPLNADSPVPGRGPWQYDDHAVTPGEVYSYRIVGLLSGGGERTYGPVIATAPSLKFALYPAAPSPAKGSSNLRFDLPQKGKTVLKIYDVAGRLVKTLVDGTLPAGHHAALWDGRDNADRPSASGIYLVRIIWQGRTATRRLVLLR